MKLTISIGELFDRANDISAICSEIGLNEWCLNEGLSNKNDEISIDVIIAKRYGII